MSELLTMAGVCTGIGGFDLAFSNAGFKVIWGCELDKPCRQVLATRFPGVLMFDDMLSDEIMDAPAPDVFVGGTPCQGFSIAGLRKGLDDDRSNLALRFIKLCDQFNPRVILWENVDGVLSDSKNAFGCFLAGLVGADASLVPPPESGGRWTCAGVVAGPKRTATWRVLDSEFFGVAQRRNRVFVVASPGAELPFEILFEPEGLRRHLAPSREARKEVAGTLRGSSKSGDFRTTDLDNNGAFIAYGGGNPAAIDVATACNAHGGTGRHDFESETFVSHTLRADGFDASEDGTGRGTPLVPVFVCMGSDPIFQEDCAMPITQRNGDPGVIAFKPCFVSETARRPSGNPSDQVPALTSNTKGGDTAPCVVFTERTRLEGRTLESQEELAYALTNPGSGGRTHSRQIMHGYAVRRLTPRECERLQAFPDDWSLVPNAKGKPMADGPRYRQCGNAVTVSVIQWLATRIKKALL